MPQIGTIVNDNVDDPNNCNMDNCNYDMILNKTFDALINLSKRKPIYTIYALIHGGDR